MANRIVFREDLCKGCALCVAACPKKIVAMSSKLNAKGYHTAECTDESSCIACAFCARMCPDSVISVYKEAKA